MGFNLRNRHFLRELDFTPAEWRHLLDLAAALKTAKRIGVEQPRLGGKNIALIFEKTSTRTRCAFEVAAHDQGRRCGVEFGEERGIVRLAQHHMPCAQPRHRLDLSGDQCGVGGPGRLAAATLRRLRSAPAAA